MANRNLTFFQCIAAEWPMKFFVGGVITGVFWLGYFLLEYFPIFPVRMMPSLSLDQALPFLPQAAFIYVSQFFTMPLVAWLLTTRAELSAYCKGVVAIAGSCFLIFFFFPTMVLRPSLDAESDFIYRFVISVDNPHNAFPSLHAAFGIFTAGCAWEVFKGWKSGRVWIGVIWFCTAAVLVSTLLTKQHVVWDIVAGGFIGYGGYLIFVRAQKRISIEKIVEKKTSGTQTV